MESSSSSPNTLNDVDKLIKELPKVSSMESGELCKWEGFWFWPELLKPAIIFRSSFEARDDDVFLASSMKTGTTWLKALTLYIMQSNHTLDPDTHEHNDILTMDNPHFHVPTIESLQYSTKPPKFDPYDASVPRFLHTHLPYAILPDSIKTSKCKIVYIARNPKDTVTSMWHFFNLHFRPNQDPFPLEKTVDYFCSGIHSYGPFFEHLVEYWNESKKRPEKILFVKYEELKSDPKREVSRIAEFLGRPFGDEGEVDQVIRRCSLERLKNLEVNKSESLFSSAPNSIFFRKGKVGDWKNFLTREMEMKIDQTTRIKLEPFGLFF